MQVTLTKWLCAEKRNAMNDPLSFMRRQGEDVFKPQTSPCIEGVLESGEGSALDHLLPLSIEPQLVLVYAKALHTLAQTVRSRAPCTPIWT